MLRDLVYGWRSLVKQPGFAAVAVLTLALCIGANTAMFTLVDHVLLRAMPYPEPERIVAIEAVDTRDESRPSSLSYADFFDWKKAQSMESMALHRTSAMSLALAGQQPMRVDEGLITGEFFDVFRLQPLLGRMFTPDEERLGAAPVVVLSEHFWRDKLNSSPGVAGTTLLFDGLPYTVVGVVPDGLPSNTIAADVWAPVLTNPIAVKSMHQRGHHFLNAVGRVRSTIAESQAELSSIAATIASTERDARFTGVRLVKLSDYEMANTRAGLWLLLSAVAMVLLIGCANIANVLQAKGAARQREIAIRLALGAPRMRVVRQLLTEALLLSGVGGMAGLLVGWWLLDAFVLIAPEELALRAVQIDARAFVFTLVLALLAALVFGTLPAFTAVREASSGAKASAGKSKRRLQRTLVVVQVVLALVLSFSATLVLRAFEAQRVTQPGFNPHGVTVADVSLPAQRYDEAQRRAFFTKLLSRAQDRPELGQVALLSSVPFSHRSNGMGGLEVVGKEPPPEGLHASVFMVSEGAFDVMGFTLRGGRKLRDSDSQVTLINETFAKRFWPEDPHNGPIGQVISSGSRKMEIIGVVADVKEHSLQEPARTQMLLPLAAYGMDHVMLASRAPSPAAAMRRLLEEGDATLSIGECKAMDQLVGESLASDRFVLLLLGAFSALALGLAALGIYGVTSYNVEQRRRELGIRIALGANDADIYRLLFGEAARMLALGLAGGGLASFFVERALRAAVEHVEFRGEWLGLTAVLLTCVVAVATFIPARRALRIDPHLALRSE